ncbi:MAG: FkbM family methyltransferase, partial [Candidatus Paceibacteria bacterium]
MHIIKAAVSSHTGKTMIDNPENTTASIKVSDSGMKVDALDLSHFFKQNNIEKVDFIKIDVEGEELEVIKGLNDRIRDVSVMTIEVHNNILTENEVGEILTILDNHGEVENILGEKLNTIGDLANTRQIIDILLITMADIVSLIIPTYNRASKLKELLESLQCAQGPYQIIVVDDQSTDNTENVAKDFDIDYVLGSGNGQVQAKQTGLELAEGKYIGFLEDDMVVSECFLEPILQAFRNGEKIVQSKVV